MSVLFSVNADGTDRHEVTTEINPRRHVPDEAALSRIVGGEANGIERSSDDEDGGSRALNNSEETG